MILDPVHMTSYKSSYAYTVTPYARWTSIVERNAVLPVTGTIDMDEFVRVQFNDLKPAVVRMEGPSGDHYDA